MLVSPADVVAKAKATIHECSVLDVRDCATPDTLIIDIREAAEHQRGRIPGSVLLPRGLLEFEIHPLVARFIDGTDVVAAEVPIVLYCGTGGRSALAADTLQRMGYKDVRSMSGGIVAWAEAKLPIES